MQSYDDGYPASYVPGGSPEWLRQGEWNSIEQGGASGSAYRDPARERIYDWRTIEEADTGPLPELPEPPDFFQQAPEDVARARMNTGMLTRIFDLSDVPDLEEVLQEEELPIEEPENIPSPDLETDPLDRITHLAVTTLRTPVAIITVVDEQGRCVRCSVSASEEWQPLRGIFVASFREHPIALEQALTVEDTRKYTDLFENTALRDLNAVALACAPLSVPYASLRGAFVITDFSHRVWSAAERAMLAELAELAAYQLDLEHANELPAPREAEPPAEDAAQASAPGLDTSLVDWLGEGVFAVDLAGRCSYVNPTAAQALGYAPDELIGQPLHPLLHHHHADGMEYFEEESPLTRAVQVGQGIRLEEEILWRKDGEPLLVAYTAYPTYRDGSISGAAVVFSRSTVRGRAETGRLERREPAPVPSAPDPALRAMLDEARAGTELAQANLRRAQAETEHALAEMTRAQGDRERLERRLVDFGADVELRTHTLTEAFDMLAEQIAQIEAGGQVEVLRVPMLAVADAVGTIDSEIMDQIFATRDAAVAERDGLRQRLDTATAERDALSRERERLAQERVTIEAERNELALERDVFRHEWEEAIGQRDTAIEARDGALLARTLTQEERTALLIARDAAFAERDAAHEVSRRKSDFLASMSHEIRTPLNSVIGMSEILLDTALDEEQREYATLIRMSGTGLLDIVNQILDLSKIEAGKLMLETREFQPRQLVEQVAEMLTPTVREKQLMLFTYIAPEIPVTLRGDPTRLRQILVNLAGNAVKFTSVGEVVIRAALETTNDSHAALSIAVSDTGMGISEAARERIFEPFIQADDSITGQYGGTGLGLSIAQRLVELMGGTIGVESVEGEGATFWFTVALERVADDAPPAVSSDSGLRDKRVLVVDGNRTNLDIMESYMSHWGMRVESARTGLEALTALRRGVALRAAFDVVMLDSALPDMDAVTLVSQVQADARLDRCGFIIMPPVSELGEPKLAPVSEFAASLAKPVKHASLREALVTAILAAEERAARFHTMALQLDVPTERTETMVLVVEDNVVNQKLAGHQLQRLGYAMHKVNNGREAVERLAQASYGVVLMDCQMPGMDGYAATRAIRQAEAGTGRHTPIIAVTAHALDGDRERCLAAGMDDYVAKPVSMEALRTLLERYMPKE